MAAFGEDVAGMEASFESKTTKGKGKGNVPCRSSPWTTRQSLRRANSWLRSPFHEGER